MSGWIFVIGMVVFLSAIGSRVQRRDERQSDLAQLDEEIRLAKFWNWPVEGRQKDRADKIAEHKNWRNNVKFELVNWTAFLIGAAILLVAVVFWFGENPSHTWDLLLNAMWIVVAVGLAAYWVYHLIKRLAKAESEIGLLSRTLTDVKDHAVGSIEEISELKDRLDKLEARLR